MFARSSASFTIPISCLSCAPCSKISTSRSAMSPRTTWRSARCGHLVESRRKIDRCRPTAPLLRIASTGGERDRLAHHRGYRLPVRRVDDEAAILTGEQACALAPGPAEIENRPLRRQVVVELREDHAVRDGVVLVESSRDEQGRAVDQRPYLVVRDIARRVDAVSDAGRCQLGT